MDNYQLPTDGSVIIIDDEIEEALPLIKLLSQKGIAFTYYTGKDSGLPKLSSQKIRLAFVDIQLFGPSDPHSYAQNILRILDGIIPDNNGPYIVIVWSKTEDINADVLELELTAKTFTKKPIAFLRLSKSSYFTTKIDNSIKNELMKEIKTTLETRFGPADIAAIKGVINQQLRPDRTYEPKNNFLKLISKEIQKKLKQNDVFQLFTLWESVINKSSGTVVTCFSTLHEPDEFWEDNLKSVIYRMAHAQLGKKVDSVKDNELIKNALKTMNQTFLDTLENEISRFSNLTGKVKIERSSISFSKKNSGIEYKVKWNSDTEKYQLFIGGAAMPSGNPNKNKDIQKLSKWGGTLANNVLINELIKEYKAIRPNINTKLLIECSVPKSLQPGNVYEIMGKNRNIKKEMLKNYFKKETSILSNEIELDRIILIELEVSPLCDYAQDKWLKSRWLPGILIPEDFINEIAEGDFFYEKIPLLIIKDSTYKPFFDFRLLKSTKIVRNVIRLKRPLFRVRTELFADILSRLSSHSNRIGITCIE